LIYPKSLVMKKITFLVCALLLTIFINAQCKEPTNLFLNNENYVIFLQWDENGEDLWDIEYGETGFSPTGIPTEEDLSSAYFDMNSLLHSDYYDLYVRADCGATTSAWVGPFTFYNYCIELVEESIYEGIYEEFENGFIPYCWAESNQGTPATKIGNYGNSVWEAVDFANNSSYSLGAKINISGTDVNDWLVLPPMRGGMWVKDVLYEYLTLDFYIALTQNNTTETAVLGSDDQVQLVISTDLGETWTILRTWNSNSTISNTGEYIYIEYEDWELFEKVFLVAFWASSGTVNDSEDIDFFIDHIFALSPVTGAVSDLKSKGFTYYPNPSENTINLSAKETINQVTLYNSLGQKVKQVGINILNHQLDISELPEAIYYMQVRIGDTIGVVPLVKKQ